MFLEQINLILFKYKSLFMQNCYNILITGKVQDIGFRALAEDIAKLYDLKGFVFNDPDGSIKMVCCGDNGIITNFLEELEFKGTQRGAVVDEIKSEEIPFEIFLPQRFQRLYTDELADIGRKLDKGNELLNEIKKDTSSLPEIKDVLNSYIGEQREHNQWMKEHNQRLERILEKLAER
ncbi:MAG: acylphosphatase [Euryarchaeota archaeon]|nr:acylphosphatase [Euryarchaeota archaeon]